MKGIVSLLVLVITGFVLLIFSFKEVSTPPEGYPEAEDLQVVIDQLDVVRKETVSRYLDGDALLNGDSYQSYDQARNARLNRMSHQELVAELKRLEAEHIRQAARLAGIVLPAEEEAGETWGLDDTIRKASGAGCMGARSAYSSYMSSYYDDFLRYQAGGCFDDFPPPLPYFFMDPTHEEYTVTMPAAITDDEPESFKVWVSPGKMEMLKQKQKLDKMLIDDVLRMTGKLP